MVQKYGSQFRLMMCARSGSKIIRYAADGSDAGLYLRGFVNDFRTPLAARGSVEELEALLEDLGA